MIRKCFTIASAVMFALLLVGNASAAPRPKAEDPIARLAVKASPMKANALEKLYAGRTWKWTSGGGYFSAEKTKVWLLPASRNKFAAQVRNGTHWSYAEGTWRATDDGKLCMRASWFSNDYRAGTQAVTCFLHRETNGVIYQKPSIGGKWYVFRNNPVRKDDEVRKLVSGDRVSTAVARIKASGR
ncbi:DUF995 domain-containing protein [Rhizobium tibeticum]|uniref:DUF995 domain-containing protein n=1 Tax=Rhizobium tibeticum TaxID=501024 RepID=UPI0027D927CA|nr:DUF995 domain-containing protein [Rhizobium tibeticum]